ncbi:hypothetical protein DIE19_16405 [Burkholderia sp. Bp9126]|nr:hypothetical protein DIE19_16405 [Burkholderia sp. Bp9126]
MFDLWQSLHPSARGDVGIGPASFCRARPAARRDSRSACCARRNRVAECACIGVRPVAGNHPGRIARLPDVPDFGSSGSSTDFLAGYGAAQAVPGPLFTFAAFLGWIMRPLPNGAWGALLATVGIFLPGLLLVVSALPYWQLLRTRRARSSRRARRPASSRPRCVEIECRVRHAAAPL